jgi:hypothetical protein
MPDEKEQANIENKANQAAIEVSASVKSLMESLTSMGDTADVAAEKVEEKLKVMLADNGTFVEKMGINEKTKYVLQLKKMETLMSKQKVHEGLMLQAYIRKNEFELEMQKITLEKMETSEKGFTSMMTVRAKESQLKINEFFKSTLGISYKAGGGMQKLAAAGGIAAAVFGVMSMASESLKARADAFSDSVIRSGGTISDSLIRTMDSSYEMSSAMGLANRFMYTNKQAMEIWSEAMENGVLGLSQMTQGFNEYSKSYDSKAQSNVRIAAMSFTFNMKALSTAIFGTANSMPELFNMMKTYRMSTTNETMDMMAVMGRIARDNMLTSGGAVLEFVNSFSDRVVMTGANAKRTIGEVDTLVKSFSSLAKTADERALMLQTTGKILQSFDFTKFMAVSGGGDIASQFKKIATGKTSPAEMFATYFQGVSKAIGGTKTEKAAYMAMALPEFKGLGPGLAYSLSQAFQKLTPETIKAGGTKAFLMSQGLSEQAIRTGSAIAEMGNVQNKAIDVVIKLGEQLPKLLLMLLELAEKHMGDAKSRDKFKQMNSAMSDQRAPSSNASMKQALMGAR